MQPRTIYVSVASFLLALLLLLLALNPSETRHIDHYVAKYIAWHNAHVQVCPHCNTPADPEMVRDVFTRGEREGLRGLGLRRRNFFVCSVLAPGTDGRSRTFGCLGFVFGPRFPTEFPCRGPQDAAADALIESKPRPEPQQWIEITVAADGTTTYEGQQLTWDDLIANLSNREDRDLTGVLLLTHPDAKISRVQ